MADPGEYEHFPPLPPGTAPMWAGVIAAPAAWFVAMQTIYTLTPNACQGRKPLLVVTDVVFLAATIAMAFVCWRYRSAHAAAEERHDRIRFLGSLGVLTCIMTSLVIIAQGIASIMLDPCAT